MQYRTHPNTIKRQNREMALRLALLALYGLYRKFIGIEISATIVGFFLITAVIKPELFNPLRVVWFKLATILGAISSRIILALAYIFVLLPVSLLKRKSFNDHFFFNEFKKNKKSVFHPGSESSFKKEDIVHPY